MSDAATKGKRNHWFRFYNSVVNDPKVQRLSPQLFKTWVNLLCLASENDGFLPSDDDIAFQLRLSATDAEQQIGDLILAGLIDIQPDGKRTPHNWSDRQFKSDKSAERTRKWREKKKKAECDSVSDELCDVTVTAPEKSRDREEQNNPPTPLGGSDDMPSHVKPVPNWSQAFTRPDDALGVVVTEGGRIRLEGKARAEWLEKFKTDERLDLALDQITIQRNGNVPLAAQVRKQLAAQAASKIDREQNYQTAVAVSKAEKAQAKKPFRPSRW